MSPQILSAPARAGRSLLALSLAIPWLLSAVHVQAQETLARPTQDEARLLFDGKSLEGWKEADFYGAGKVEVGDGAIVLKQGTKMTGITTTLTDLPHSNYELSFQARRIEGNDFFAAATFPVGDAFITLVNGGWGGSLTGLSSLDGSDASENETGRSFKYQNGTWYHFRVQVTEKVIVVSIDDKPVVRARYEGRHVSTRIESRRNQPLGFAAYESTGAVRAIQLRPLTPAEAARADESVE